MADETYTKWKDKLVNQKITQQITVAAGAVGRVTLDVPKDHIVFLAGLGYTWFSSQKYTLDTGNKQFPSRSDQEGSIAQPMMYGMPFPCRSGGQIKLTIENNGTSENTYDVVFYIQTDDYIDFESSGRDITTALGGTTEVKDIPFAAMAHASKTIDATNTAEPLAAASTPCRLMRLRASTITGTIYIGGSTVDATKWLDKLTSTSGTVDIPIDNLTDVYVYGTATDVIQITYFT